MFESRTFRDWIGDPPLYDLRDESIPRAVMAIGHDYPPISNWHRIATGAGSSSMP